MADSKSSATLAQSSQNDGLKPPLTQRGSSSSIQEKDSATDDNALSDISSSGKMTPSSACSDVSSPPKLSQRPQLAYLRSTWSSGDFQHNTGIHPDNLPPPIHLPAPLQLNENLVRREVRRIASAATGSCIASAVIGILVVYQQPTTSSHPTFLLAQLTLIPLWFSLLLCLSLSRHRLPLSAIQHGAAIMAAMTTMIPNLYNVGWSWTVSLSVFLAVLGTCFLLVARQIDKACVDQLERFNQHLENEHRRLQTTVGESLEKYRDHRLSFLATVSQEIQDAALMVITTLEQFSPATILANTHELLSACSIAVPIASISAINTTIKQVCYVSSHLQLVARLLREGSVPNTNTEDRIRSETQQQFDIGDLVQNVGDALAGMASKLDVNLVIYHSDSGLHYNVVTGDEGAVRHGLLNLLRNVLEGCTPGACIELGLNITPSETNGKLCITFEITHTASPAIPKGLSPAILPNANLTAQLLHYIGGTMTVSDLGQNRTRYEVFLELDAGKEEARRLVMLKEPSLILPKQYASIKFSNEPTMEELTKFIEYLKGLKMVLHAREHSVFAKHLTSCLASWNADISHVPVVRNTGAATDDEASLADETDTNTSMSSAGNRSSHDATSLENQSNYASPRPSKTPPVPSPAIEEEHIHSIPPAFLLIDDDVETLERKIREFRSQPPASANVLQQHVRRHKHTKSGMAPLPNFFHQGATAIIHFTSLTNYKRVRDTVQWFASSPSAAPFSMPRLVVVPKPAGPRRFLTALHTSWHNAIVEPHFMPIATSPSSPVQHSIVSVLQRESHTPPTPGSAHIGTPMQEMEKISMRSSPGEGGPVRRRPMSGGVYSPPVAASADAALEGNTYFPMMGSAASVQGGPATSPLSRPVAAAIGSSAASNASNANRRLSNTELESSQQQQQAQQQQPSDAPLTSPRSQASGGSDRESPRADRRRRNTAHERPLEAMQFMAPSDANTNNVPLSLNNQEPSVPTPLGKKGTPLKGTNSPLSPPGASAAAEVSQEKPPSSTPKRNFKLNKKRKSEKSSAFSNVVSPPINVLIVEDNMINQAILSTWMKKHKIKYSVASNGQEAVERWKGGGFHLVLMDIQLPVMDGIEATKMIRAIEKEQKTGVLPTVTPSSSETTSNAAKTVLEESESASPSTLDKAVATAAAVTQEEPSPSTFRSPVIIVALTASSLESDRHAALAAGCNDFLTKPVSLEWLEKKIVEWGCMQALIDFEGWRQWKRAAADKPSAKPSTKQQQQQPLSTAASPSASVQEEPQGAESDSGRSRKGIVLPGAAGLNKRRFSTMDPPSSRKLMPVSKSGSDPDLLAGVLIRSQSEKDWRQRSPSTSSGCP